MAEFLESINLVFDDIDFRGDFRPAVDKFERFFVVADDATE
jgi:hypothetical protein